MSISASEVKKLREMTGAGMMDSKAALVASGGNMAEAVDWLRKKGIAKADKKAGRTAAEGLIGLAAQGHKAVLVEVNSETDFVARNADFQQIVRHIAEAALQTDGVLDAVLAASCPGSSGKTVAAVLKDAIGTIGENMALRRVAMVEADKGVIAAYMHNSIAEGLGKIGVLVALETAGDKEAAKAFGRQVAMHVAATNPLALTPEEIDAAAVEREKTIFAEQARQSGKPEAIIEKMVEGRLRKFYEEVVLLSQAFVVNPDMTVAAAAKEAEKAVGAPVKIVGYVRFALGEGIEKEVTDFAAEVAAAAKS
ncbi:translation elongation factor Ts [Candidatus Tokpelaia sp.]|uniref:translation elongation factor Ts n=1 Tax=Candidatus Tokpelaia sp. TaxID=2233777 RepID=UPI0012396E98|nr:translation elongation factor Ts [Candidatus Tokpelaia sp.]KAA6404909.1 elongation factor Ts [Candidatus Tokpelaia sp.]